MIQDSRTVMTLDAGGTSFKFSAIRGNQEVTQPFALPSNGHDLEQCLETLTNGFRQVRNTLQEPPVAISFAFPGPCDYTQGIIGDLHNLPCFRGGVPLGPMLEETFGIPTFINNDGDLFVYGEAIAGLLPYINALLEESGSPKRYKNLFGVTLGTGFGGGITSDGRLLSGDNICAAEVWILRNKLDPGMPAEEGACIRAVRSAYAESTGTTSERAPDPKDIYEIAIGKIKGDQPAAVAAYRRLGEVVGDAMASALTLVDGLAVIGGGISGASPIFLPVVIDELNSDFHKPNGEAIRRLSQVAFNLEDPTQLESFLKGDSREVTVPGTTRTIRYDPMPRIGVGVSRLGTSKAVAIGAYAFALNQLDSQ